MEKTDRDPDKFCVSSVESNRRRCSEGCCASIRGDGDHDVEERYCFCVAANGSFVKNCGEKKIVGHTDDGGGVSMRAQCADIKKVLCSVHKMNLGGNFVVLDGERTYTQNKETKRKTKIN